MNTGALDAGIFISSLVCGFLPFLALLFLTSKVPKPTNWTLSFAFSASETTEMKAKELSAVMDSLVTLAKRGDLHARRQAAAYVRNVEVDEEGTTALQKLFNEIGPAYANRNGGYTRVVKTRVRRGDAAPMAIVQFVK